MVEQSKPRCAGGVKDESRIIPWFWLGQPLDGGVVYTKKGTQEESWDFCGVR